MADDTRPMRLSVEGPIEGRPHLRPDRRPQKGLPAQVDVLPGVNAGEDVNTTPAPVAVFDCDTPEWDRILADQRLHTQIVDWLRANHIEPNDTWRVEVYLLDTPYAQVYPYACDDAGRKLCDHDRLAGMCTATRREPVTVLLASLPPTNHPGGSAIA